METGIIVEKDKKRGYRKLFIGFFIIMAVLTILSKVIDSVIIPKVQVNSPTAGNLSYSVVGAGVVKASETGFIDIPEGIKVDKVLSSGQKVETGQGIVFLRVSHLEEKKKELERELAKIQLSLEREKLSGKTAAKTTEQELMAGDLAQAQKNLFDSQVKLQGAQDEYTMALEKLKKKRARDKSSEERRLLLSMGITPGMLTNGNEIVEIGSGNLLFLGTLQKEDAGILEEGDKIEISMPMQTKKVIGTIRNISINTGAADTQNAANADTQGNSPEAYAEFTAELLEGDYRIGSTAEYAVNKNSQLKYPCIIPVEAVREDGNGKYCLVAEKRTTILGEEEIAVRVNIELIEKDAAQAAVGNVFGGEERIITASNKAIKEGDRVRIQP